jgi:hypothetical protein
MNETKDGREEIVPPHGRRKVEKQQEGEKRSCSSPFFALLFFFCLGGGGGPREGLSERVRRRRNFGLMKEGRKDGIIRSRNEKHEY